MKQNLLVLITIFTTFSIHAQDDLDAACQEPSKKVMKFIDAAKKAQSTQEVQKNFSEAIKLDRENATAYYEFALFYYKYAMTLYRDNPNPSQGDKALVNSKNMFERTIEICPEFHANCYYYLGVIAYNLKDIELANSYFQQFADFKSDDNSRYPDDYKKKLDDIQKVLKKKSEEVDFTKNPVPFSPSLVKNVSSKSDEYFPMLSPDNELLFYTRKVDKTNKGDMMKNIVEEFTYSERPNYLGQFNNGKPFSYPFNDGTFQSYGSATMSVDNKEMILCACKDEFIDGQTYRNCDLYSTKFERSGDGGNDFKWTPLENLGPQINSPRGWDAQPSLSADGNTLFYTTLRAGRDATQDNDIWIAERKSDGTWGAGRPFEEINTAGKDKSPFLHQDSETLYFVSSVSDKRKGVGGLDIFYMRKENGKWTEPKNLGYPINSTEDEIGLFVSLDGKEAFFSSRTNGTNWDIYSFELYEEARPQAVKIVKGELKDEKGAPIENAEIEVSYSGSDESTTVKVNGNDGKYAAVVRTNSTDDVIITAKKEGSAFSSKMITNEALQKEDPVIRDENIEVKELKEGEAYTINDILFATNSYELTEKSKFIIKQFAKFLKQYNTIEVVIQGHTDDIGDDNKNLVLSENRAKEVKKYLESLGISAKRLNSVGYGETQPKVPNTNEQNRAVNRRTEFLIKKI
ncbi:MAG TPA: OmpA family protein [Crocinitomicaceae bacterium]|nr:OmpA family protein [Crocinitomicaceae bacterium]